MSETGTGRIVVRGSNILRPPLLDTSEAALIEFRDRHGDLHALFCRILADDMWGLVTRNDPEWQGVLLRYGYRTTDKPIAHIIQRGL